MKTTALFLLSGAVLCIHAAAAELSSDQLNRQNRPDLTFNLPAEDQQQIAALSSFGTAMLSNERKSKIKWLLSTIDADPSKVFVLKALLKNFNDKKSTRQYIPELVKTARRHPQALPLNLAALALSSQINTPAERRSLAANCLNANAPEQLNNTEFRIYANIAAILCSLYTKDDMYKQADEMLDRLLKHPETKSNMTILKAAALLYSKAARNSSKERRFLGLMSSPAAIYAEKKELAISLFEKIPAAGQKIKEVRKTVDFWNELDKPDRAEGIILRFLSYNPKSTAAKLLLISLYNNNNRRPEAILLQEQMCLEFPSDFNYFRLGAISYDAQYYFNTITALNWCMLKNPDNARAVGLMALACYMNSQPEQALCQLKRSKGLSQFDYLRLSCLAAMGKYREAFALFRLIMEKTGLEKLSDTLIFAGLGLAEKVDKLETVKALATACIARKQLSPELANAAGYTCANNNIMLDTAEKLLRFALKSKPGSKEILDSMAWLEYRKGNYKAAAVYIRKSLAQCGKYPNPEINIHAGDIYYKLEKPLKALRHWKAALQVYSRDTNAEAVKAKIAKTEAEMKYNQD
ncbi:hypothetical protein P0136_00965 [Lentisphaerota bacterium ZTH]|nr:hypothetical protein JYG24_07895 [Lentisphaerota bacterium]WET06584.1 hypothetical protein P0136_00965 [Lentisphaerota bacterium ZTH]